MDEQTKAIVETMEKKLPEVIDGVVSEKIAELNAKSAKELEEIKSELKKITLAKKETSETRELKNKTAMVSIIKNIWANNVSTESGFKRVVESEMKTMNEGTAGAGAELVFTQFAKDIQNVINEYGLVNMVSMFRTMKTDKFTLPKVVNGITTFFVAEGAAPTGSEATTSAIEIAIYKAVSLVDMTDEVLDDNLTIPDLYNLIVRLIGESQAEFLETKILLGTGTSDIEGILVNADTKKVALAATETGDDIGHAYLTKVKTAALMKYKRKRANLVWIMSQYTFGKLEALLTADGYPLYPSLGKDVPTLRGSKIELSDVMPVQEEADDVADAIQLVYGDPKFFALVKRNDLTIERGYYGDNWKDGINTLKGTQRFGGKCTFGEAFAILKNGPAA